MPVTTPRPPHIDQRELQELVDELQALIEEARRRARRRRRFVATVVIAALVAGAAALFRGGGDGTTLARSSADASLQQPVTGPGTSAWSATNGPDGAFVTAFAATPDALYAGTIGSGAFKSTDRGRTWHALRGGLPASLRVDALAVDPTRPRKVYAGTSLGVFESTNAGRQWHLANRGLFRERFRESRRHRLIEGYISGLVVDPSRPRTVLRRRGPPVPERRRRRDLARVAPRCERALRRRARADTCRRSRALARRTAAVRGDPRERRRRTRAALIQ